VRKAVNWQQSCQWSCSRAASEVHFVQWS